MLTATRPCPACAAPASGRFCSACGAALDTNAAPAPPRHPSTRLVPWVLGSGLLVTLGLSLFRSERQSGPPSPARRAAESPPPDIAGLTPRQRFDRLYQRVITAAQTGDQTTVTQLTPMAVAAYQQLDSVTIDARYHLAMLQLHVGNLRGAQAQADTIRADVPDHLFGFVIGAAVARWRRDDAGRDAIYRAFAERYQVELATNKPEYQEHRPMLVEVARAANVR